MSFSATAATALTKASTPEPEPCGLLDTCVVIDRRLHMADGTLPSLVFVSAVTFAELAYGVALAPDPVEAAIRAQALASLKTWVAPTPFDGPAADKYGEMAALVAAAGRSPRPRRLDLMIAATAASRGLPLYTVNAADFIGLESAVDIHALPSSQARP
jgi:predicted nucleic acid-binding protein